MSVNVLVLGKFWLKTLYKDTKEINDSFNRCLYDNSFFLVPFFGKKPYQLFNNSFY